MACKSLDLGCGKNKQPGCIGLDMNPGSDADIIFEFKDRSYLPFADNSFNRVFMLDFIEHVEDIPWLLSEVHRISEPDARIEIKHPHRSCRQAYGDVTHRQMIGLHAFDHFDPSTECGEKYSYYTFFGRHFPYRIEDVQLQFSSKFARLSKAISHVIGADNYERFVTGLLPIGDVNLELRVIK